MDMIKLSKRLFAVASLVTEGGVVADIGTDHAFLPCYLIQTGRATSAFACDIANGPLISAKKTVLNAGLLDKIQLIQSNGFENVSLDNVSDSILAGMGGELILEILLRDSRTKSSEMNFILQPMTQADRLRRGLYRNGFCIVREVVVSENNHHYAVLQVKYTGEKREISDIFSLLGLIDKDKDAEAFNYIKTQRNRLLKKAQGLKKSGLNEGKYQEIIKLIDEIDEKYLKAR